MTKKWQRFEKLARMIQQQLAPEAQVKHNQVVVGKSGAHNQLDVTVHANVGQYKFFCVIECKDWESKVDIDTVRAFASKVDDVGAAPGVIVSANGFTSEALKYAKSRDIYLYRLVDAETTNWQEVPMIPVVVGHISLKNAETKIIDTRSGESVGLMDDSGKLASEDKTYFFEIGRNRYIKIRDLLEEKWDEVFETREPESDEWFETEDGAFFLYEGNDKLVPVVIQYRLEAETIWYYGHLSLKRCKGFLDEKTGNLLSSEYESEHLIFSQVIKSWPSTKDKSQIPFSTGHCFFMGKFFKRHFDHIPAGAAIVKKPSNRH